MFRLKKTSESDKELLIKYKLLTIYEYAKNLDELEIQRIESYVNENVSLMLSSYDVILVNNQTVGSFLVVEYEDGIMLDEIYLEKEFRNKGIGTMLIKDLLNKHNVVYLWVYKENKKAIKLYESLNFKVLKETETRYFMKHS